MRIDRAQFLNDDLHLNRQRANRDPLNLIFTSDLLQAPYLTNEIS